MHQTERVRVGMTFGGRATCGASAPRSHARKCCQFHRRTPSPGAEHREPADPADPCWFTDPRIHEFSLPSPTHAAVAGGDAQNSNDGHRLG